VHKREVVLVKTCLCAQARSCFGENPFVCTSVLIVCKRHTPIKNNADKETYRIWDIFLPNFKGLFVTLNNDTWHINKFCVQILVNGLTEKVYGLTEKEILNILIMLITLCVKIFISFTLFLKYCIIRTRIIYFLKRHGSNWHFS